MKIKKILLLSTILVAFSGCRIGPSTYEVWERTMNVNIGTSLLHRGYTDKDKKIYDKNHYIYTLEYPKKCFLGFLVKKNNKKKIVVSWVIISGKEFCKDRQATVLIQ